MSCVGCEYYSYIRGTSCFESVCRLTGCWASDHLSPNTCAIKKIFENRAKKGTVANNGE
jgi:hypothetical protein